MKEISCMGAAGSAWRKMALILFKPYNFAKWVTLGFCAWIAYLGGGAGGNFNFRFPVNQNAKIPKAKEQFDAFFNALREIFNGDSGNMFTRTAGQCHISVNLLTGICAGIALVILIIIAISLVLAWLKSRFGFILLDNLIHDRNDITGPWRKFKTVGNSAFLWRLVIGLISAAGFMLLLIFDFISILPWLKSMLAAKSLFKPDSTVIAWMIIDGLILLIFCLLFALVEFFFEQFVVPVMYWSNLKAIEAWKKVLALAKGNIAVFVRYILLYIVFSLMAGGAILLACLATCCIGFILLAIPFVGTVLILPVLVFFRLFGVELLARFAPEYNIPVPPPEQQDTAETQELPAATEPPAQNASGYRW